MLLALLLLLALLSHACSNVIVIVYPIGKTQPLIYQTFNFLTLLHLDHWTISQVHGLLTHYQLIELDDTHAIRTSQILSFDGTVWPFLSMSSILLMKEFLSKHLQGPPTRAIAKGVQCVQLHHPIEEAFLHTHLSVMGAIFCLQNLSNLFKGTLHAQVDTILPESA